MKNKILFRVVLVVLFISLGLNIWLFLVIEGNSTRNILTNGKISQKKSDVSSGISCEEQDISRFNAAAKKYDYEKIDEIYKDILKKEKYDSDMDCMTILTISNLYLHRNEKSRQTYEKMKKLFDEGEKLNNDIHGIRSMKEFNESVYRPENIPRG